MQDLRILFEGEYPGKQRLFETLIKPIFSKAKDTTLTDNQVLADSDEKQIKSFSIIAQVRGGFPIVFADVELQDTVALKRSRVNIQNCVRKVMQDDTNAIIFFHFTDNAKEWRVSYVHRAETNRNSTSAKRYTYLCGPEHSCRTVSERFATLKGLSTIKDEDMIEAFSVEPLSKDFFDKYREHYADLVEYISGKRFVKKGGKFIEEKTKNANGSFKNVFDGDDKAVRDFVKKMMGRLVFLQFLQKKGWLGVKAGDEWGSGDKNFLENLFKNASKEVQDDFLEQALEQLFFKTLNTSRDDEAIAPKKLCSIYGSSIRIPYLNGGLFEEDELDKKKVKFKKEHFASLFEFFNRYNFTIDETDPDDTEIGVDPEMLGKIFENLLEDNKDKGAFYTPKEIVQYMCRESLIAYLLEKIPSEEKVRNFVLTHEQSFTAEEKTDILEALRDVKICDPAVGSGAFPMGMLNELLACTQALIGESKSRAELKKHIVKNNIYGVDIEKGAVDIARLRFWLAIIVDEEEPLPLPNLDYKIMQGNSLLESFEGEDLSKLTKKHEYDDGQQDMFGGEDSTIASLAKAIDGFYVPSDQVAKAKIRKQIAECVIQLLKEREFSPKIIEELEKIELHENSKFFLWHTWFNDVFNRPQKQGGAKSGFDIVIGNPPYVQIKWLQEKESYKKQNFKTFESTGDIYCLFYEKGMELLRSNGILAFITSNKWLKSNYGMATRNFLLENSCPKLLVDLGAGIFENASVNTNIILLGKGVKNNTTKVAVLSESINNLKFSEMTLHKDDIWNIESGNMYTIKKKIERIDTRLSDFNVELNYGILTGANKTFILTKEKADELIAFDKKNKEIIKPILRGKDLGRYAAHFNNFYLLFAHNGVKSENILPVNIERDYPTLIPYFESFGKKFKNRGEQGDSFYNLRNCAYIMKYLEPKIIYADIVQDTGKFYLDEEGYFTNDSAFLISGENLRYLLGILNSKAFTFFYKSFYCGSILGNKGLRYKRDFLLKVPIPVASATQQKSIIDLVNKILSTKKADANADTTDLEKQIDMLVYKLYDLTDEEISVIENYITPRYSSLHPIHSF